MDYLGITMDYFVLSCVDGLTCLSYVCLSYVCALVGFLFYFLLLSARAGAAPRWGRLTGAKPHHKEQTFHGKDEATPSILLLMPCDLQITDVAGDI